MKFSRPAKSNITVAAGGTSVILTIARQSHHQIYPRAIFQENHKRRQIKKQRALPLKLVMQPSSFWALMIFIVVIVQVPSPNTLFTIATTVKEESIQHGLEELEKILELSKKKERRESAHGSTTSQDEIGLSSFDDIHASVGHHYRTLAQQAEEFRDQVIDDILLMELRGINSQLKPAAENVWEELTSSYMEHFYNEGEGSMLPVYNVKVGSRSNSQSVLQLNVLQIQYSQRLRFTTSNPLIEIMSVVQFPFFTDKRKQAYIEWLRNNGEINPSFNAVYDTGIPNLVKGEIFLEPTKNPTGKPTNFPTSLPTHIPTLKPISNPTTSPTDPPIRSGLPTFAPTSSPIGSPTLKPIFTPTQSPTIHQITAIPSVALTFYNMVKMNRAETVAIFEDQTSKFLEEYWSGYSNIYDLKVVELTVYSQLFLKGTVEEEIIEKKSINMSENESLEAVVKSENGGQRSLQDKEQPQSIPDSITVLSSITVEYTLLPSTTSSSSVMAEDEEIQVISSQDYRVPSDGSTTIIDKTNPSQLLTAAFEPTASKIKYLRQLQSSSEQVFDNITYVGKAIVEMIPYIQQVETVTDLQMVLNPIPAKMLLDDGNFGEDGKVWKRVLQEWMEEYHLIQYLVSSGEYRSLDVSAEIEFHSQVLNVERKTLAIVYSVRMTFKTAEELSEDNVVSGYKLATVPFATDSSRRGFVQELVRSSRSFEASVLSDVISVEPVEYHLPSKQDPDEIPPMENKIDSKVNDIYGWTLDLIGIVAALSFGMLVLSCFALYMWKRERRPRQIVARTGCGNENTAKTVEEMTPERYGNVIDLEEPLELNNDAAGQRNLNLTKQLSQSTTHTTATAAMGSGRSLQKNSSGRKLYRKDDGNSDNATSPRNYMKNPAPNDTSVTRLEKASINDISQNYNRNMNSNMNGMDASSKIIDHHAYNATPLSVPYQPKTSDLYNGNARIINSSHQPHQLNRDAYDNPNHHLPDNSPNKVAPPYDVNQTKYTPNRDMRPPSIEVKNIDGSNINNDLTSMHHHPPSPPMQQPSHMSYSNNNINILNQNYQQHVTSMPMPPHAPNSAVATDNSVDRSIQSSLSQRSDFSFKSSYSSRNGSGGNHNLQYESNNGSKNYHPSSQEYPRNSNHVDHPSQQPRPLSDPYRANPQHHQQPPQQHNNEYTASSRPVNNASFSSGEATPIITNNTNGIAPSSSSLFTHDLREHNAHSGRYKNDNTANGNDNYDQNHYNSRSTFESRDTFATNTMMDVKNNSVNNHHQQSNHAHHNHPSRVETNPNEEEQVSPVTRSSYENDDVVDSQDIIMGNMMGLRTHTINESDEEWNSNNDDPNEENEDVAQIRDELEEAIEKGDWSKVKAHAALVMHMNLPNGGNISNSSIDTATTTATTNTQHTSNSYNHHEDDQRVTKMESLIGNDDWKGLVKAANHYAKEDKARGVVVVTPPKGGGNTPEKKGNIPIRQTDSNSRSRNTPVYQNDRSGGQVGGDRMFQHDATFGPMMPQYSPPKGNIY